MDSWGKLGMSNGIPEGWEAANIGEVCHTVYRYPTFYGMQTYSEGVPVIRGEHIMDCGILSKEWSDYWYVSEEYSAEYPRTKLNSGDVVMAVRGTVGKFAKVEQSHQEAQISPNLIRLAPDTNKVDAEYFYQALFPAKDTLLNSSVSATGVPALNASDIKSAAILLPPLPEQQIIASILTSVDEVIEQTGSQISKLQDLKKGVMQELLTKGIGHTEFKDSPVGRIPKEWDAVKLGNIVSSLRGGVSVNGENKPKQSGEFGVLKVSSVNEGQFIPSENKRILESELHRAKIHPKANHVLFSRANTPALVGESGYIEYTRTDLFLPDKLWMLDIYDRKAVNIRWLSYVLAHGRTRKCISDAATGTSGSMKNISKPSLMAIYIAVPSKHEQDEISASILSLDKTIKQKLKKLLQLNRLKNALMQDLLTGKVRVKTD